MADTIKTVKPSGGDYSTLEAWEAGQQKTISSGNREIAECDAMVEDVGATYLTITGWGTAADASILIRAAAGNGHGGDYTQGYRYHSQANVQGFYVNQSYVRLEGLVFRNDATGNHGGYAGVAFTSNGVIVETDGCYFVTDTGTSILDSGSSNTKKHSNFIALARNLNAYSLGNLFACNSGFGTNYLYNGVIIGAGATGGISVYYQTVNAKNVYIHSGTAYNNISGGTINCTTCAHSSSETKTGSTASTAYNTSNLTNITDGSYNFAPPSGSALIDAGTDLSGDANYPFSTDILGATRSGTWEIGPFNYAAAAATLAPPPYRTQARRIAPLLGF